MLLFEDLETASDGRYAQEPQSYGHRPRGRQDVAEIQGFTVLEWPVLISSGFVDHKGHIKLLSTCPFP